MDPRDNDGALDANGHDVTGLPLTGGGAAHVDVRQLDRYLAGDATPDEAIMVSRWLQEQPERRAYYEALRQGARPRVEISREAVADARTRVVGQARRVENRESARGRSRGIGNAVDRVAGRARRNQVTREWLRRPRYAVATGIGLVVMAIVLARVGGLSLQHGTGRAAPMLVYATGAGQRANITLSDGSTVALNVASRLEVPADYLAGNHALRLTGEALFTVSRHDRKAFTVSTGQVTAQVLGTSFIVRRYATDAATTVAVREGKVKVGPTVVPATRQVITDGHGVRRLLRADLGQFSFASGVLTLTSVRLADAVPELNRWYNADVRLNDPALADQRLTGEYTAGSVADLANILTLTFNLRVERDGKLLTLYVR